MKNNKIIIPVIAYSCFTYNKENAKEATVYASKFDQDISTLISAGYSFVSLSDIADARKGITVLAEKSVCIVFVGGYASQYDIGFQIAKKNNAHVDVFVADGLMGLSELPDHPDFTPHFGWEDAIVMCQSGFADVYAMWHPFDNGKKYKNEIARKVCEFQGKLENLYRNKAFLINMESDSEEKQEALGDNGIELNLVYFYTSNIKSIEKGNIPYITINHESNILDIIEAFNNKTSELINRDEGIEEAEQKSTEWEATSEGVIIPIDTTPRIRNLLRNAIPLSVIGGRRKDKAELIVLNNYIDVVFRPWYHFFDYDNHLYLSWRELKSCVLEKDFLRMSNINAADAVINGLRSGYCIDAWADEYYIPGKAGYNRQHLAHNLLIYGYDAISKVFLVQTYTDRGYYESIQVAPADLIKACNSEYFLSLQLIKHNTSSQVTYDISILKEKLQRYVSSGYEYANNTKNTWYDVHQLCNFSACLEFPKYIEATAEKENRIYHVCFYGYLEHKKCMAWRALYIANREELGDDRFSMYEKYASQKSDLILHLGLKYNFTGDKRLIKRIVGLMEELNEKEHETVSLLINEI